VPWTVPTRLDYAITLGLQFCNLPGPSPELDLPIGEADIADLPGRETCLVILHPRELFEKGPGGIPPEP
jgi:hypothetical protein